MNPCTCPGTGTEIYERKPCMTMNESVSRSLSFRGVSLIRASQNSGVIGRLTREIGSAFSADQAAMISTSPVSGLPCTRETLSRSIPQVSKITPPTASSPACTSEAPRSAADSTSPGIRVQGAVAGAGQVVVTEENIGRRCRFLH